MRLGWTKFTNITETKTSGGLFLVCPQAYTSQLRQSSMTCCTIWEEMAQKTQFAGWTWAEWKHFGRLWRKWLASVLKGIQIGTQQLWGTRLCILDFKMEDELTSSKELQTPMSSWLLKSWRGSTTSEDTGAHHFALSKRRSTFLAPTTSKMSFASTQIPASPPASSLLTDLNLR